MAPWYMLLDAIAVLGNALSIPHEREKLMRLEQKLIDTVHDKTCQQLEMRPMTSHNRRLVHALAKLYGFEFAMWSPSSGAADVTSCVGTTTGVEPGGVSDTMGVTLVRKKVSLSHDILLSLKQCPLSR